MEMHVIAKSCHYILELKEIEIFLFFLHLAIQKHLIA